MTGVNDISASGIISASTLGTSYISATSGNIGGVSLSNNDLTNVSDISASGTISTNYILQTAAVSAA